MVTIIFIELCFGYVTLQLNECHIFMTTNVCITLATTTNGHTATGLAEVNEALSFLPFPDLGRGESSVRATISLLAQRRLPENSLIFVRGVSIMLHATVSARMDQLYWRWTTCSVKNEKKPITTNNYQR